MLFIMLGIWPMVGVAQGDHPNVYLLKDATIIVDGKTNINEFTCKLNVKNLFDTLQVMGHWDGESIIFEGLNLVLPIEGFDCGMKMMTKEFRTLVDMKNYPWMSLDVRRMFVPADSPLDTLENLITHVQVSLKENQNIEEVNNGSIYHGDGLITLQGSKRLNLEEYGIDRPKKFFGVVEVQEFIDVFFDVELLLYKKEDESR